MRPGSLQTPLGVTKRIQTTEQKYTGLGADVDSKLLNHVVRSDLTQSLSMCVGGKEMAAEDPGDTD